MKLRITGHMWMRIREIFKARKEIIENYLLEPVEEWEFEDHWKEVYVRDWLVEVVIDELESWGDLGTAKPIDVGLYCACNGMNVPVYIDRARLDRLVRLFLYDQPTGGIGDIIRTNRMRLMPVIMYLPKKQAARLLEELLSGKIIEEE